MCLQFKLELFFSEEKKKKDEDFWCVTIPSEKMEQLFHH